MSAQVVMGGASPARPAGAGLAAMSKVHCLLGGDCLLCSATDLDSDCIILEALVDVAELGGDGVGGGEGAGGGGWRRGGSLAVAVGMVGSSAASVPPIAATSAARGVTCCSKASLIEEGADDGFCRNGGGRWWGSPDLGVGAPEEGAEGEALEVGGRLMRAIRGRSSAGSASWPPGQRPRLREHRCEHRSISEA
eukprot:jgi/Mesvir1/16931/Mv15790-RA.1